ncbi:ATP-binding protein [Streptomyces hirsutus]|uniref:ATP-binding protein n=1 Tax=Streptomyces hirsutus TaxID=35620 RepID=A0ABZ1GEB0_9ACTN|nr:ATP-binding protein [Streptomyces hirsutus]WSD04485.1 ATP-binding protein [Streptomyces hirsutus]WTD22124.1 ATP-binding protein [Streptomyces hirsutus]WTD72802.1 ATP-binding protein [Streptomyces sp. NBC_01635]
MNSFTFIPATKEQAKARIALTGPTGSGKTYTALVLGTGIGDRIALIDTEHGSASKYADEFAFDTLPLTTFEPPALVEALAVAAHDGYDVVIVDSLSHFWSGSGGMLEQVDNAAKRIAGGNTFAGWREARPLERAMIDALLAYPGHLVATMRTKTEYVVEADERGRKVPRKVGLKPEQREGIEYEFDIVGDLDHDNTLVISKSRAKPLSGLVIRKPDAAFAEAVLEWLNAGKPTPSASDYLTTATAPHATYEELRGLYEEVRRHNLLAAAVLDPAGGSTTLGELIVRRGTEAKKEAGKGTEQKGEAA